MSFFTTTVAANAFLLNSDGYTAGQFLDDPVHRYNLRSGVVASTQTIPIYGGQPISLKVPTPTAQGSSGLGMIASLATTNANIEGWCCFQQASAGIITPFSNAPLYYANNSLNFFLAGSSAAMVLPVNPAAVNTLAGGAINVPIYWNFTAGYVDITGATPLGLQILGLSTNSLVVNYSAGPPITANFVGGGSVIVLKV
jgi:hypothetical protein